MIDSTTFFKTVMSSCCNSALRKMNIWISFIIYMTYRLVRFMIHSVQRKQSWDSNGVDAGSSEGDCQLLSIVHRRKLVEGDMISANDFIWWQDKFVEAKDVLALDPCWTLYTLDHEFVYFVLMPKPWPAYHAREAPFIFVRQYEDAMKLARMTFKAFCRFAEESLSDPRGPVVYYSYAARSGSTLLTKAMQVSDERIRCFSVLDAFTAVAIFQQRGFIPELMVVDLLKAIFKFYCKTQEPGQTYLLRISNGVRIVPLIKRAMPSVKHIFTYRRNPHHMLRSLEKMIRGAIAGDVWVTLWNIWPELACEGISAGAYEYELFKRFGIKDVLDIAIIMHVATFYYYHRCRDLFDIPIIYYEDLIAEKEKTLRPIFEICGLPFDALAGEALKEFSNDSQVGTAFSQRNMKTVKETPLGQSKILKIHDICDELDVPRIEV